MPDADINALDNDRSLLSTRLAMPRTLTALLLISLGTLLQAGTPPAAPNIVLILADDLGYGDIGAYGQEKIQTPSLDRLAAEGIRFTDAYAGSSVCAPSRCVLMTGRHLGHATVRGNRGNRAPAAQTLRDEDITVAEILRQAGYRTAAIGKWGLGDTLHEEARPGLPTRQGFDTFFGYLNQRHAHNSYPTHLWRDETRLPLRNIVPDEDETGAGVASQKIEYAPDVIHREALAFLRRQGEETPFFLYYAPTLPHANNESRPLGLEIPDLGPYAGRDWPEAMKRYAAMVTRLDRYVGEILATLHALDLDANTLVLFTSDNGPHAEVGGDPAFFGSSGPFRGHKRALTEGGIRVPAIARWPGHTPAGRASTAPWSFADILPTFAELAGIPVNHEIDGISIVPTLLGRDQPALEHRFLYWESYTHGFAQAARRGRWKALRPAAGAPLEIYDLANDPGEEFNLASRRPSIASQFEAYLATAREDNRWWSMPTPLR